MTLSQRELAADTPQDPFGAVMKVATRPPVVFVAGEGSWLRDPAGRRYLDFIEGWALNSLGHCPPAITAAMAGKRRWCSLQPLLPSRLAGAGRRAGERGDGRLRRRNVALRAHSDDPNYARLAPESGHPGQATEHCGSGPPLSRERRL